MQKHFVTALLCLACSSAMADDVIVFRSGEVIRGKVEEISTRTVRYKKSTNLDGPSYTTDKRELLSVQYDNGTTDLLSDPVEPRDENQDEDSGLRFCPQVAAVTATQGSCGITGGGGVEFIANFKANNRVKMGPGIGMMGHNYEKGGVSATFEIPVFFNAQYHFTQSNINPYIQGQVGYNFGAVNAGDYNSDGIYYDREEHMSLFVKVGAGLSFNLRRGAIFVDLGYKLHQWTIDSTPYYGELTIGYCFRHH